MMGKCFSNLDIEKKFFFTKNIPFFSFQIDASVDTGTKMMLQRIRKMREKVPPLFEIEEILEKYPVTYENSLNNVLRLEVTRYNALLAHIHQSLSLLEKALKGETVMSVELERNYESLLFKNELPETWWELSFPTEANLR